MIKYNAKNDQWELYCIPIEWNVGFNLDHKTQCAGCGRTLNLKNARISRHISSSDGKEYFVCDECYEHEIEDEKKYHRHHKKKIIKDQKVKNPFAEELTLF